MSTRNRLAVVGCIALALMLAAAAPALADVTGPCTGTATIDGIEYDASYDTDDNPIVVPEEREGLQIPYEGSVSMANTNYLGAVGVVVGPFTVNVADWGLDENLDDIRATNPGSVYVLGSGLNGIVGLYELTAFHDADGGSCDATAMVKLEGNPLSSPIGIGAVAGAVLAGAGVVGAGVGRKNA